MTAFEIASANRALGIAEQTLQQLEGVPLRVAEQLAYAQAHATLAVAWLQLDAARSLDPIPVEGD